jgi:hypothetical protein
MRGQKIRQLPRDKHAINNVSAPAINVASKPGHAQKVPAPSRHHADKEAVNNLQREEMAHRAAAEVRNGDDGGAYSEEMYKDSPR